jgi:hypothetical protein
MVRRDAAVTVIPGFALDDELARMLGSVDRARRNRWREGELTDARYDDVLAAVTNRAPLVYAAGLGLSDPDSRPNRWHEDHVVTPGASRRS